MKASLFVSIALLAAVTTGPAHAEPGRDVRDALERIVEAGGFHARVQGHVFGPGLDPVSGELDVVFPDRAHLRGESIEFIIAPAGAWVSAFGLWAPTDRDLLPFTAFDPVEMRRAIASIRDVREVGRSRLRRCEARVYRFRASGQLPGAGADGEVSLWICEDSGRAARLEATGDGGERVVVDFDDSRKPRVDLP